MVKMKSVEINPRDTDMRQGVAHGRGRPSLPPNLLPLQLDDVRPVLGGGAVTPQGWLDPYRLSWNHLKRIIWV